MMAPDLGQYLYTNKKLSYDGESTRQLHISFFATAQSFYRLKLEFKCCTLPLREYIFIDFRAVGSEIHNTYNGLGIAQQLPKTMVKWPYRFIRGNLFPD